jgi:hypothetical protein
MTYVPTSAGFIYLAMVLDVWSRRVVGWAIGEQMTTDLVLAALNMAITQRRPTEVIHHSDQGSQHERRFRPALREDGRAALEEKRRRRVRQRNVRKLLRRPRVRADRPAQLPEQGRGATTRSGNTGPMDGLPAGIRRPIDARDNQRRDLTVKVRRRCWIA